VKEAIEVFSGLHARFEMPKADATLFLKFLVISLELVFVNQRIQQLRPVLLQQDGRRRAFEDELQVPANGGRQEWNTAHNPGICRQTIEKAGPPTKRLLQQAGQSGFQHSGRLVLSTQQIVAIRLRRSQEFQGLASEHQR
jgi:hypothetical protein